MNITFREEPVEDMKRRVMTLVWIMAVLVVMMFCYAEVAMADEGSGVYDGVNWKVTDDYTLVLGDGTLQTFASSNDRGYVSYPWITFGNHIKSVRFDGIVRGNGSMRSMFSKLPNLESFDATGFDVSRITDMENMFAETSISGTLDLTGWDVSHVQKSDSMFNLFKGNLIMPDMQWSRLTGMYSMFNSHDGTLEIPNWSFGVLEDIGQSFTSASGDVNAANWDLDGVLTMRNFFRNHSTKGAAKIDLSGWHSNTLTEATACFTYSNGIKEIDVSNWDMPALTNIYEFFGACNNLERVVGLGTWDVSNITTMGMLFYNAVSLVDIGDISQWDTSNVTDMVMMFFSTKVRDLDLSGWDVSNVTSFGSMFYGSNGNPQTLDLSSWCDITPRMAGSLVSGTYSAPSQLMQITVGNEWRMKSDDGSRMISLNSTDGVEINGVVYSDYWYHESREYGPFRATYGNSTNELAKNYTPEMAGTWLREPKYYTVHFVPLYADASGEMEDVQAMAHGSFTLPSNVYQLYEHEFVYWQDADGRQYGDGTTIPAGTYWGGDMITLTAVLKSTAEYTIQFVAEDASGSMPQVTTGIDYDYQIPENRFVKFDSDFDHWDDGKGHTYADGDLIPEDTYEKDELVTLTAVFVKRIHDVQMEDGAFTFSIKKDETAVFSPIPSNTSYQVYERLSDGWILVVQQDSSGEVKALQEANAGFINQYKPNMISVQLNGSKFVNGKVAAAGSYQFELLNADHELLQTVSVKPGGLIQFDPLEFTKDETGLHQYYIREIDPNDDAMNYDMHEESIVINVYEIGETITKVLHSDNLDDDGNMLRDHGSYELYKGAVSIPGAEQLNVHLVHSNVRGQFYLWKGNYSQYLDGISGSNGSINGFSSSFNSSMSNVIRYNYISGLDHELQTEDFIVEGDALTAIWTCYAFDPSQGYYPNGPYSDMVNYGYYITVTAGKKTLAAEIVQDDDGIVFTNVSKPGNLILSKVSGNGITSDGSFVYELQFMTENGQPYEFPENVISFETREGISVDYPDLHRPIERPKYNVVIATSMMDGTGTVSTSMETFEYEASKVLALNVEPKDGYYCDAVESTDCSLVQATRFSWKGVMPNHDVHVNVQYLPSIDVSGSVIWDDGDDDDEIRPASVVVHLIDEYGSVASQPVEDPWTFTFTDAAGYRNGEGIEYTFQVEDVDEYTQSFEENMVTMHHVPSMKIDIVDVTLLSDAEYTTYRSNIVSNYPENSSGIWWLRSPSLSNEYCAACVDHYRSLQYYSVSNTYGVRPALICNLRYSNLQVGDKIFLAGKQWAVICTSVDITEDPYNGKAIILCDDLVDRSSFKNNSDHNCYVCSDVRSCLENWAIANGIMPESTMEISVSEITLLSKDEYTAYQDNIPMLSDAWWWLRSNSTTQGRVSCIDNSGSIGDHAFNDSDGGVRPALMCDLGVSDLSVGDKVSLAGYTWTVITVSSHMLDDSWYDYKGKAILLCDDCVGMSRFGNGPVYNGSYVKLWLADWAVKHPFSWPVPKTVPVEVID